MSYSVDVNIFLYASDTSAPKHAEATRFLEQRVADPDLFCIAWSTIIAYLRITTHPRIFASPLSPSEALGNVESLLSLPRVRVLSEAEGFLDTYRGVTAHFPVRGNLVPDAHLAALLRQHGVRTLYTSDRDFRKFDFLDVADPFE
ncbi:MAG: VapC toxin family PIN domain ribonuclease [Candidatus Methylomirabilota bacterium]|nr:PIN domain-containing protein [Candidatus Methylomirabilis sp.]PWB42826.1 MAG: VapC toxin family PIN domain ribonuclease [candidate division NC10 bacterium]